MRPLTVEEQQIASNPELLEIAASVARGFARSHRKHGDLYDEFLSACHGALMQTAMAFEPGRGSIKALLTVSCRQRCVEVSRQVKRRVLAQGYGTTEPETCDVGFKRVDAQADAAVLLNQATPRQREVVQLRLKGWTFDDIGLALGLQQASVHDLYTRFISSCQRRLAACSL